MIELTVGIPVFNGEHYIEEALHSIANQTRRPDRVVVFDNCSTDRTRALVRTFPGLPIELICNQRNIGLFGNHNRCLALAPETEYLHIMHADDKLLPPFYDRMIHSLRNYPPISLAWAQAQWIGAKGESLRPIVPVHGRGAHHILLNDFLKQRARLRADIYISGALIRTGRQPMNCHFPEDYQMTGDHIFWALLATQCRQLVSVSEIQLCYRRHAQGGTCRNYQSSETFLVEDLRAIQTIENILNITPVERWVRQNLALCFFAALVWVKRDIVQETDPVIADRVLKDGRRLVPLLHWMTGSLAFFLRKIRRSFSNKDGPRK